MVAQAANRAVLQFSRSCSSRDSRLPVLKPICSQHCSCSAAGTLSIMPPRSRAQQNNMRRPSCTNVLLQFESCSKSRSKDVPVLDRGSPRVHSSRNIRETASRLVCAASNLRRPQATPCC
jgi:hypothetical protein